MDNKNKIQELRAEIHRLEKEDSKSLEAKYQYLIGKCLHRAHTSYEKITGIDYISKDQYGEEVIFECIYVYFDNRGDEYNFNPSISVAKNGTIESRDIERCLISQEVFNNAFESCVELIRKKTI